MRNDNLYLRHIADSISIIESYLATAAGDLNRRLFFEDLRTQDAVLRRLETLTDAAGHLSVGLKARHPQVPWRQITDFRNILAHGYTGVNLDLVWDAILRDLPALKALVRADAGGTEGLPGQSPG